MATTEQIYELRTKTGLVGDDAFGADEILGALIDITGSTDLAAADIWQRKAATYAELVDTSESGSSRSMSQLHRNALEMFRFYNGRTPTPEPTDGRLVARSRRAVREGGF